MDSVIHCFASAVYWLDTDYIKWPHAVHSLCILFVTRVEWAFITSEKQCQHIHWKSAGDSVTYLWLLVFLPHSSDYYMSAWCDSIYLEEMWNTEQKSYYLFAETSHCLLKYLKKNLTINWPRVLIQSRKGNYIAPVCWNSTAIFSFNLEAVCIWSTIPSYNIQIDHCATNSSHEFYSAYQIT